LPIKVKETDQKNIHKNLIKVPIFLLRVKYIILG